MIIFNFSSAIDHAFSLFIFFFCSCQIKDLKRRLSTVKQKPNSSFVFFLTLAIALFFARKEKENRTKRIKKMAWISLTQTLERRVRRTRKLTDISFMKNTITNVKIACLPLLSFCGFWLFLYSFFVFYLFINNLKN